MVDDQNVNGENNTAQQPDEIAQATPQEIQDGKALAILSYFWLWFLPYLMAKDNRFAMFHAKLGLILFIIGFVGMVLTGTCVGSFIGIPLSLFAGVFAILGIVKAIQGEMWKMPLIYELVKKLNF